METLQTNKQSLGVDFLFSLVLAACTVSLYFANRFVIWTTGIVTVTAVVFVLYTVIKKKQRLVKPYPLVYCWLGVYLIRVIWLSVSNDPQYGLGWLDTCFPFIIFPFVFLYIPLNDRIVKTVLAFFVHFSLLFCLLTIASVAYESYMQPVKITDWLREPKAYYTLAFAWTNYNHPSFLSVIYLFALPVSLYLKHKYRAIAAWEIILLILSASAVILLTGSRIGMLLLPLLLFIMLLYILPKRRRLVVAGAAVVVAVAAVATVLLTDHQIKQQFSDPIREQLWRTTLVSIKEKPLLGVGTGGMREVFESPELAAQLGYERVLPFSYPHNQYLGEVMHFGFIGAGALFAALTYLLIMAFRKKNFLLLCLLSILGVFMFTEMPFDLHKGLSYVLFFISFLTADQRRLDNIGRGKINNRELK